MTTLVDERQRLVAEQSAVQLDEAANVVAGYGLPSLADIFRKQATAQRDANASRPQEQPHKATGEMLTGAARAFDEYPSDASPYVNGRLTPNGCARLEAAINAALAVGNIDGHA